MVPCELLLEQALAVSPDSSVEDDILPAALGLGSGSQVGIFCGWEVAFLEVGHQYPDLQEGL